MAAYASSAIRYTLAIAVIVTAVAGFVFANGNGQPAGVTAESAKIDVAALLSSTDIADLPVLQVEQPF